MAREESRVKSNDRIGLVSVVRKLWARFKVLVGEQTVERTKVFTLRRFNIFQGFERRQCRLGSRELPWRG